MKRSKLSVLIVALACVLTLTSCGNENASGSADLEFDVTDGGMLLPVDNETCVDKLDGTGSRSASSVSANFGALRMKWIPKYRTLYVGLIRLTFKSSKIVGGSTTITLGGDEIEALLGANGQIISPDTTNGNKAIVSNKANNRTGFPICALNVGGIELTNQNPGSFSASVTIELIGQGSGSDPTDTIPAATSSADGSKPYVVRQTYTTTATYY